MKTKRIALATSTEYPHLPEEERLVIEPLLSLGVTAEAKIWDDPSCDWGSFDAVIIRSVWDYYQKIDGFRKWVDGLESSSIHLFNPAPVLRWNMEKTYLKELEAKGLPTIPAVWTVYESTPDLIRQIDEQWWARAIVKPTLSARAHQTYLVDPTRDKSAHFSFSKGLPLLIQPYLPEIEGQGEWSFVFFGGKFSHCVLKKPKAGDFRVHLYHGGTYRKETPPPAGLDLAEKIIKTLEFPLLYARIDLVEHENRFLIMELEFLEPSLYLEHSSLAPHKFAEAIAAVLT